MIPLPAISCFRLQHLGQRLRAYGHQHLPSTSHQRLRSQVNDSALLAAAPDTVELPSWKFIVLFLSGTTPGAQGLSQLSSPPPMQLEDPNRSSCERHNLTWEVACQVICPLKLFCQHHTTFTLSIIDINVIVIIIDTERLVDGCRDDRR